MISLRVSASDPLIVMVTRYWLQMAIFKIIHFSALVRNMSCGALSMAENATLSKAPSMSINVPRAIRVQVCVGQFQWRRPW